MSTSTNDIIATLRSPTKDEFTKMAKDLKLSDAQAVDLVRTVSRILANLAEFAERTSDVPDRSVQVDRAGAIDSLLQDLEKELKKGSGSIRHIGLPNNFGLMGGVLSFQAFAELAPELRFEEGVGDFERAEEAFGNAVTLLDVERHFDQQKRRYDLHHRPEILLFLVKKMREQFDQWLAEARLHKGGAPRGNVREYVIYELACDAGRIIGSRPTTTARGRFARLCAAVFAEMGLSCKGLEAAVARALKKYKVEIEHWHSDPSQRTKEVIPHNPGQTQ